MEAHDVMTLLLVRFAIVAGGIALLAVAAFTVLVVLKRNGKQFDARRYVEPVVRSWARSPSRRRRGGAAKFATRTVLNYLDREGRR
jgi:hypothetical protein